MCLASFKNFDLTTVSTSRGNIELPMREVQTDVDINLGKVFFLYAVISKVGFRTCFSRKVTKFPPDRISRFISLYLLKVSKVGDRSRGQPEGSLFNSYYTEVLGALLLSLYCWVLSKETSSTILKVFGMTRPGIEPMSSRP